MIVPSGTAANLGAVAYDAKRGILWAVGSDGVILRSEDQGKHWQLLSKIKDGERIPNLSRIRFFGEYGYIVGTDIVLEYKVRTAF